MTALPQRPSALQLFTAYNSAVQRWPGALRAALAILLPGSLALALGYDHAVVLVSAGACAVIYGEGHPYRTRWRVILTAGLLLLTAATCGALVGEFVLAPDHGHWWLALSAAYVIAIGTVAVFAQNALRLPPPGCFFLIMVGGGSTMVARASISAGQVALWCAAGVAASLIIGLAPYVLDPHGPERRAVTACEKASAAFIAAESDLLARHHQAQTAIFAAWQTLSDAAIVSGGIVRRADQADLVERTLAAQNRVVDRNRTLSVDSDLLSDSVTDVDPDRTVIPHTRPTQQYRLYRSATADSHPTLSAQKVLIASALTAVAGIALGLNRPDWGAVSVLLLLQWGPDRLPGTIRGFQRMVGSALGVALFAAFHAFGLHGWTLLIALALCQYAAEVFVVRNYAICVIFSTPLALLMGNVSGAVLPVVGSRMAEIALSVVFSLAVLWLWRPRAEIRNHRRLQVRCCEAMSSLLGALLTQTPEECLAARRDLNYELLSERRSIQSLASDYPAAATELWNRHEVLHRSGYALLDFCSTHPFQHPSRAELEALTREVAKAQDA